MKNYKQKRKDMLKKAGADAVFGAKAFGAFGNRGTVREIVYPRDGYALLNVVKMLKDEKPVVLGGATDVLFPDGVYDGAIISTARLKDVCFCGDRVYCQAGARLPEVVAKCARRGLSGFEQLSGIPGSVGGAIAMNAGAFGREIAELLTRVDAVTSDGIAVALSPCALDAGYRHTSVAEKGLTVTGAEFRLTTSSSREIEDSIREYGKRRRDSQPQGKSLGSVFKRADGVSAGYYIERAGLKGIKTGGAEISSKHANFIVNNGGATAADFIYLADKAKNAVKEKFGIELEYEVIFLKG